MTSEVGDGSALRVRHAGASHVGLVRAVNEDAWVAESPVFAVADGMGGHAGGDVASRLVVEELARLGGREFTAAEGREAVLAALVEAQSRLRAHVERHDDDSRISYAGTTVVVGLLVRGPGGPAWLVAHVGDSRAYAVLPADTQALTADHSVVAELVARGELTPEEARVHPERHVVTRAVSSRDVPEPDFHDVPLVAAPRLLLCSDGVSGLVGADDLAALTAVTTHPRPQDAATALVRAALSAGGTDNATALVVDVVG
ncbi:PP2C family protein-serine/threonine phosphatase [Nocardioides jishulii]|uniref:Serine/threonine-protein phosphatase n=1 Tax=Nocardioides jishulii TaxID=2575440 RepID=A0A4U2YT06_9ACTN|nr:protein phosphatase 2C domain-containing protein [Nocardioides jishulii]QCX28441.1 serine/threonine-protein phosphatase [Nocardioides jishulii]TKI64666.1 serine/threonine-protein phosphatase [Nocardioides jishulii]